MMTEEKIVDNLTRMAKRVLYNQMCILVIAKQMGITLPDFNQVEWNVTDNKPLEPS